MTTRHPLRTVPFVMTLVLGCTASGVDHPSGSPGSDPSKTHEPSPAGDGSPIGDGPEELEPVAPAFPLATLPGGVHGMAFGPDGDLWVSDTSAALTNRAILVLPQPYTGDLVESGLSGQGTGQAFGPAGLTWDGESLLVCDLGADEVRRYDRNLELLSRWRVPAPFNVAALSDGRFVVVSYYDALHLLGAQGEVSPLWGGLDAPFGLVALPDDTFWVAEQGRISPRVARWNLGGELLEVVDYPFDNPEGLWLDDDVLVIADTGRDEVLAYAGATTRVVRDALRQPIVIAGRDGGPLVTNLSSGALVALDLVGIFEPEPEPGPTPTGSDRPFRYDPTTGNCLDAEGREGYNALPEGEELGPDLQCVDLSDRTLGNGPQICARQVDLRGANLTGAQLVDTEFLDAKLEGANLEDVHLFYSGVYGTVDEFTQIASEDCTPVTVPNEPSTIACHSQGILDCELEDLASRFGYCRTNECCHTGEC